MVGWLSGFRAQTGSVAYWCYATFVRSLGEAAAPGGGTCVPCHDFTSNTLAFVLQLRKIKENFSKGKRMALCCSAPNAIRFVDLAIAGDGHDWPAVPCRPWLSRQAKESTLGLLKYLPSCRNRGFPTSANFDSKLTVKILMWPAHSGMPKSSCICLLLAYQWAPIPRRRHLDCNTCNFRTWERAADFHTGHAYSIRGRISCLYSRTPFLTDRSLFLFRKGASIPIP